MATTQHTDIWTFAAAKVANKGVWARMGHSSSLHKLRSAVSSKGSFASKGLGVLAAGARGTLKMIPLPVIGKLISSATSIAEKKIRAKHHEAKLKNASPEDHVKFSIKELSIENLDRYRFKITLAVDEMHAAGAKYANACREALEGGKVCEADLAMALKIMQAERRLTKFEDNIIELQAVLSASIAWAHGARASVATVRKQVTEQMLADLKSEKKHLEVLGNTNGRGPSGDFEQRYFLSRRHGNCGEYCQLHAVHETSTPSQIIAAVDWAARNLAELVDTNMVADLGAGDFDTGVGEGNKTYTERATKTYTG